MSGSCYTQNAIWTFLMGHSHLNTEDVILDSDIIGIGVPNKLVQPFKWSLEEDL